MASSMADNLQDPDVLKYTNYRVFLQDYYVFKKATSKSFSLRYFADKAGLSSHAHLKLVMDGKRNITSSTIAKIIIGLGFTGNKAEYFEKLVFFNQAKGDKEKQFYYDKLVKSSPKSDIRRLNDSQFQIFQKWYYTAIRELVCLKDFNGAPEWIANRLAVKVNLKDIRGALDILVNQGLLVKSAGGKYKQATSDLTTDDEVKNILVKQWHKEMISQANNALDNISAEKRDISAVSFGICRKDFENLKKHIQLMRKELLQFEAKEGEAEDIVQVNIQLFPLTKE